MTSSLDTLKKLKLRYKAAKKGYRESQYEIFAEAMAEVVKLRSDEDELDAFVLHKKIEMPALRERRRTWITVEAVSFVTHSRKLAWKAARALEFLHDFKTIPLERLAEELREQGGIEKIAKLAAAEDPRRKKPDEAAEEVEPDDPDNEGEDQAEEQEAEGGDGDESASEDEGQDFDEEETKQASRKREKNLPRHKLALKPQRSNAHDDDDADGEISVRMSTELRRKFEAIKVGRRVRLTGIRSDKSDWLDVMLEVDKIALLKS